MESEQATHMDSIKDVVQVLWRFPTGRHIGRNNNKDEDNSPKTLNDE